MKTIKLSCPKCDKKVDWEIEELYNEEGRNAMFAEETCPDCCNAGDYSDLDVVYECENHQWDKEEGTLVRGNPWRGTKNQMVRRCMVCAKKEYYTNDGMFHGWFSVP